MGKLLRKPSPAMIVACLALFVASTGTSIAASHYLITSTKQIKPSVLTKLKGAKGPTGQSVTGLTGPQGPKGDTGGTGGIGLIGPTGPQGLQGNVGATGAAGAKGDNGTKGTDGNTVLYGTGAPAAGTGVAGNFYIDTNTNTIYGPKTTTWPTGMSLVGPQGPTGATGPAGSTMIQSPVVVSAFGAPSGTGITATVTCAAGKVLLGGGGATSNGDANGKTAMTGSYPSNTTTWVVQGVVITTLNPGAQMYAYAYAFCSL